MKQAAPSGAPIGVPVPRGIPLWLRRVLGALCAAGLVLGLWRLATAPYGGCLFCPGALRIFATTILLTYASAWGLYLSWSAHGLPARLGNFLLTTGTLTLLVAVFELPVLLARWNYGDVLVARKDSVFELRPWLNPHNRRDPELLHVHQPHERFTGTSLGDLVGWYGIPTDRRYDFDVHYDRHGFRNHTDLDRATVALIGDSFVEAPLTPYEQLLSTELGRRLQVPVVNLGQAGYGPQQELIVLQRYAMPLQPRVVLWLFFEGNDLEDYSRYARIHASWEQHTQVLDGFTSRSFTRNLLLTLASRMPRPRSGLWRKRGCTFRPGPSEMLYFAYGNSPHIDVRTAFGQDSNIPRLTEIVTKAADMTRNGGAELIFVYVPIKLRVYQSFCDCAPDSDVAQWHLADLPSHLQRWCRENGVPFLDLTPPLQDAAAAGQLVFYPDDDHWNEAGQSIAARAIAEMLAQRHLP